jgi:hypothetical protein
MASYNLLDPQKPTGGAQAPSWGEWGGRELLGEQRPCICPRVYVGSGAFPVRGVLLSHTAPRILRVYKW